MGPFFGIMMKTIASGFIFLVFGSVLEIIYQVYYNTGITSAFILTLLLVR